jgi:ketosteroid isomerase-like protein
MTFDEAFQHAQHWAAAWNAHDLDRILSFYADNVVFEVATAVTRWQKPDGKLRGKSELKKHFALGLQIAPQLKFEIETLFLAPSGYAVLYRRNNGNRVVDCVTLDSDGLASHAIAYYAGAQQ